MSTTCVRRTRSRRGALSWVVTLVAAVAIASLSGCGGTQSGGNASGARSSVSPSSSPHTTATGSPSATPTCLPAGPTPSQPTWEPLDVDTVDQTALPATVAPARTEWLPLGAGPKRPWLVTTEKRIVYHLNGHSHNIPRSATPLWNGYLTYEGPVEAIAGASWHSWRGATRDLGTWFSGAITALPDRIDSSATLALPIGNYPTDGQWRVFVARRDGCTQEIELAALGPLLARPGGGKCEVLALGFLAETEYAVIADCHRPRQQLVVTTLGRSFAFAGATDLYYASPQISTASHLFLAATGAKADVIRGYRLPDAKPLWAKRYRLERGAGWQVLGFSPSGRRVAIRSGNDIVVVEARTGQPVRRFRVPETASFATYLEDDDHLLFVDNGEIEPPSDRGDFGHPPRNEWFVRCSLVNGSCERATAVVPGTGMMVSLAN